MFHYVSHDVKIAAIKLYEGELLLLQEIADCCGFSEWTFYWILKLWHNTGDIVTAKKTLTGHLQSSDSVSKSWMPSDKAKTEEFSMCSADFWAFFLQISRVAEQVAVKFDQVKIS